MLSDRRTRPRHLRRRVADLGATSTVLVIDDLQWADQGTIDMLRFVLRRIHRCPLFIVGVAREEEVLRRTRCGRCSPTSLGERAPGEFGAPHPRRRTGAGGRTTIDSAWLHRITGGNAFFVTGCSTIQPGTYPPRCEMWCWRTVGLDAEAGICSTPDCYSQRFPTSLLPDLGVTLPTLRGFTTHLIRRSSRGVAFGMTCAGWH